MGYIKVDDWGVLFLLWYLGFVNWEMFFFVVWRVFKMFCEYWMLDLISKKRDGDELLEVEINYFVKFVMNGVCES